jgi:putative redox protein
MKARITWLDNMTFVAEAGSGHAIVVDGPADLGVRNLVVRPM